MKLVRSSMVAAALIGLFGGSARAEGIVDVKVPFPFVMSGKEFSAGRYEIRTDARGLALLRGLDDRSASFMLTMRADGVDPAGSQAALVFTPYEKGYRLSQVWDSRSEGYSVEDVSGRRSHCQTTSDAAGAAVYVLAAELK